MHKILMATAAALLVTAAFPAQAEVPRRMHFQAFVADQDGKPVNEKLPVDFVFFDAAEGGTELYRERQELQVTNGLLQAGIGDVEKLDFAVFDRSAVFFEFSVNGDLMGPRFHVRSVPYAMWAANALSEDQIRAALASNLAPEGCAEGDV